MQSAPAIEKQPKKMPVRQWIRQNRGTVDFILSGWLFSRLVLMIAAWFGAYFPKNAVYQRYIDQGFQFTPVSLIDIWSRWDARWYLSIAKYGYVPVEHLSETYSNLAFFPLYPYLVRGLTFWLPPAVRTDGVLLLIGLILSNLFLIAGLCGLYALTRRLFSEATARKTVLLTLCLPGAFFFSAFYTESLFLFLSVFACLAAEEGHWRAAAIFGALAALTRAQGLLIALPLGWLYMNQRGWNFRRIGADCLWFLLMPAGILLHFLNLYRLTGNFFAFFEAQQVWGRTIGSDFWTEFFRPLAEAPNQVAVLDLLFVLAAILLSLWMTLRSLRSPRTVRAPYAVYALVSALVMLNSGRLFSMTRYFIVLFPILQFCADRMKSKRLFYAVCGLLAALQALMYVGWVNYYWIA